MVSLAMEPWISDELLIKSGPASATGPTGSPLRSALSGKRATTADTALGSPARNRTKCRAIPEFPQARQGLARVHIVNMTNVLRI
jgi:hypothetical protein